MFKPLGILSLAMAFALAGCHHEETPDLKKDIVGTWRLEGIGTIYQYTSDGQFIWTSQQGKTYSGGTYHWIDDNHLQSLSVLKQGKPQTLEVAEISPDKMTLTAWPLTMTLIRVEGTSEE